MHIHIYMADGVLIGYSIQIFYRFYATSEITWQIIAEVQIYPFYILKKSLCYKNVFIFLFKSCVDVLSANPNDIKDILVLCKVYNM